MINAVYISIDDVDSTLFNKILKEVSWSARNRYEHSFDKDKGKTIVLGEFALKVLISDITKISIKDIEIGKKQQKPVCLQFPDYFLSLSHSEKIVFAVISDMPIGCDVQKEKKVSLNHLRLFFTKKDCEYILNHKSPVSCFFLLWTRKESFIKLMKSGFDTSKVDFFDTLKLYEIFGLHFHSRKIVPQYIFTVVSCCKKYSFFVERICIQKFNDLF